MNLLDLYEMKDPRDAYQRDVDNSRVGMNRQSRADVTGEEEPSGIFTVVIDGRPWKTGSSNEMFALAGRIANKHSDKKVAVKWPTGELNTVKPQSVSEDSQRVDSLVTDALKIMQGSELNDAVSALKTVLGDREYNSRRNYYKFYVRQLMDMYGQQGVAEAEVDSNGHSVDHADSGEYDYEGDQAKDQLNTIVRAAQRLNGMLDDNENMPEWVQMKITNAADYIDTAADYIESNQEPELAEGNKKPEQPEADYGDDYQDMVKRLKQLAGAGPLKTVYDPTKRVYRNVPVAVQPKK